MKSNERQETFEAFKELQTIPDDRAIRLWPGMEFVSKPEDNFGMGFEQPDWIKQAHNTKSGRIFIMGTGPSLAAQLPLLSSLKREATWTVNRMAHWGKLPFAPTYHSIAEPGPIGLWGHYVRHEYGYPAAGTQIAIHWFPVVASGWKWAAKAIDEVQIRWEGFFGLGDHLPPVPSGWASPLTSCQIAAWFGYTEFYFLGCDTTQMGQAWDVAHGRTAKPRSILSILECFDRARAQIQKSGRKIYDCAPGGRLNKEGVLEYRDLAEVLSVVRS